MHMLFETMTNMLSKQLQLLSIHSL